MTYLALTLIFKKVSLVYISVLPCIGSTSMSSVINELSFIAVSVWIDPSSETMPRILQRTMLLAHLLGRRLIQCIHVHQPTIVHLSILPRTNGCYRIPFCRNHAATYLPIIPFQCRYLHHHICLLLLCVRPGKFVLELSCPRP